MITRIGILLLAAITFNTGNLAAEEINPVVGKTGDFILRESDLDRIIASQPPAIQKRLQSDPQQRSALVREILTKKTVVAKARKDGFDRKPDIKEQLSYVIDNYLAQEYLVRIVAAGVTVSEEELKKVYADNTAQLVLPEQVKVRHILVAVDKTATPEERQKARVKTEALLQRIKSGEDFAKLAAETSDDENSASKGGELPVITAGKTNAVDFEKAAFALKNGEVSAIVDSPFGLHIIKMIDHQEKRTARFEEVRDLLFEQVKADKEQKMVQEFVERAVAEAGLAVAGENIPVGAVEKGKTLQPVTTAPSPR